MMNGMTRNQLTARVRSLGKELLAIANQLEAEEQHLSVNLPRDLFSDIEQEQKTELEGAVIKQDESEEQPMVMKLAEHPVPERRHYQRNSKRMQEHLAVSTAERVGKAQGFCSRSDIERSIARMSGRNREDVREAVNRVAGRMQLTCIKSRSYRYYPKSQRDAIINASIRELKVI